MSLDPSRGWMAAVLVVTFVRGAAAQSVADAATESTAAPRAGDTPRPADPQPRRTLVPELGWRTPEHLQASEQYYDFSVRGLRLRLDAMKEIDSATYARLDDELRRLERRRTASYILLGTGLVAPLVGLAVFAAAQSQTSSCPAMPSPTTPNFEAARNAWFACNSAQNEADFTPIAIGAGVSLAALVSAYIVAPKRAEMLEFVNLHNRLTRDPIRWQFGYDPARRSAFAGAAVNF